MLIERYFGLIEAQLENSPIIREWTAHPERRGRLQGYVRADVLLMDGSWLHFREYVDVSQTVERLTYAYQYMTQDHKLVFRYDNVAHHPQISTQPHHKHDGSEEHVVASSAPTLAHVLAEIERMVQRS